MEERIERRPKRGLRSPEHGSTLLRRTSSLGLSSRQKIGSLKKKFKKFISNQPHHDHDKSEIASSFTSMDTSPDPDEETNSSPARKREKHLHSKPSSSLTSGSSSESDNGSVSSSDSTSEKKRKKGPSEEGKEEKKKKISDSDSSSAEERQKIGSGSGSDSSAEEKEITSPSPRQKSDSRLNFFSGKTSKKKEEKDKSKSSKRKKLLYLLQGQGEAASKLPAVDESPPSSPESYYDPRLSSGAQSEIMGSRLGSPSPLLTQRSSPGDLSHNVNLNYRAGASSPVHLVHSLSAKESGKHVSQLSEISPAVSPPDFASLASFDPEEPSSERMLDDDEEPTSPFQPQPEPQPEIQVPQSRAQDEDQSEAESSPSKLVKLPSANFYDLEGVWRCRRCGWTYTTPYPSPRLRKEHKQHCDLFVKQQNSLRVDEPVEGALPDAAAEVILNPPVEEVEDVEEVKEVEAVEKNKEELKDVEEEKEVEALERKDEEVLKEVEEVKEVEAAEKKEEEGVKDVEEVKEVEAVEKKEEEGLKEAEEVKEVEALEKKEEEILREVEEVKEVEGLEQKEEEEVKDVEEVKKLEAVEKEKELEEEKGLEEVKEVEEIKEVEAVEKENRVEELREEDIEGEAEELSIQEKKVNEHSMAKARETVSDQSSESSSGRNSRREPPMAGDEMPSNSIEEHESIAGEGRRGGGGDDEPDVSAADYQEGGGEEKDLHKFEDKTEESFNTSPDIEDRSEREHEQESNSNGSTSRHEEEEEGGGGDQSKLEEESSSSPGDQQGAEDGSNSDDYVKVNHGSVKEDSKASSDVEDGSKEEEGFQSETWIQTRDDWMDPEQREEHPQGDPDREELELRLGNDQEKVNEDKEVEEVEDEKAKELEASTQEDLVQVYDNPESLKEEEEEPHAEEQEHHQPEESQVMPHKLDVDEQRNHDESETPAEEAPLQVSGEETRGRNFEMPGHIQEDEPGHDESERPIEDGPPQVLGEDRRDFELAGHSQENEPSKESSCEVPPLPSQGTIEKEFLNNLEETNVDAPERVPPESPPTTTSAAEEHAKTEQHLDEQEPQLVTPSAVAPQVAGQHGDTQDWNATTFSSVQRYWAGVTNSDYMLIEGKKSPSFGAREIVEYVPVRVGEGLPPPFADVSSSSASSSTSKSRAVEPGEELHAGHAGAALVHGRHTEGEEGGEGGAVSNPLWEYDFERAVREQTTHDLICPVCNSCVTKRVVLRKRKRTAGYDPGRPKPEPQPEPEPVQVQGDTPRELPVPIEKGYEAWGCLACFSVFFHKVKSQGQGTGVDDEEPSDRVECLPLLCPTFRWGTGKSDDPTEEPLLEQPEEPSVGAPQLPEDVTCLPKFDGLRNLSWGSSFPKYDMPPPAIANLTKKKEAGRSPAVQKELEGEPTKKEEQNDEEEVNRVVVERKGIALFNCLPIYSGYFKRVSPVDKPEEAPPSTPVIVPREPPDDVTEEPPLSQMPSEIEIEPPSPPSLRPGPGQQPIVSGSPPAEDVTCLPNLDGLPNLSWGSSFPRYDMSPSAIAGLTKRKEAGRPPAVREPLETPPEEKENEAVDVVEGRKDVPLCNCLPIYSEYFQRISAPEGTDITEGAAPSTLPVTVPGEQPAEASLPHTERPSAEDVTCLPKFDGVPNLSWGSSFPRYDMPPSAIADLTTKKELRRPLLVDEQPSQVSEGSAKEETALCNCLPIASSYFKWDYRTGKAIPIAPDASVTPLPEPEQPAVAGPSEEPGGKIVTHDVKVEAIVVSTDTIEDPGGQGPSETVSHKYKVEGGIGSDHHPDLDVQRLPQPQTPLESIGSTGFGKLQLQLVNDELEPVNDEDDEIKPGTEVQTQPPAKEGLIQDIGKTLASAQDREPSSSACLPFQFPSGTWWWPTASLPEGFDVESGRPPAIGPSTTPRQPGTEEKPRPQMPVFLYNLLQNDITPQDTSDLQQPLLEVRPKPGPIEGTPAEILKSIVHGGLDVTLVSLGLVSSGAGGGAKTITVVALGLANLIFGFITYCSSIVSLYANQNAQFVEQVGHRFWFNGVIAMFSFIFFGAIAPITYGFSFQHATNRDLKFVATCLVALAIIILLGAASAYVKAKSAFKVISGLILTGVVAAIAGYEAGNYIELALEKLGFSTD